MALEVLQNKAQIRAARAELKKRNISFTDGPITALAKRLQLDKSLSIGDVLKSWDVLKTVEFIERNLGKDSPILDIGCFCSEILLCLHDLGFSHLTGCDLNPEVTRMPYAGDISYIEENFLTTSFADASFDAITSISVLEHGYNGPAYIKEMSRILRPGGYLVSSFDYWPEKLDTGDTNFFGMSWTLFSQREIERLVDQSADLGLMPVGRMRPTASKRPIRCSGFDYTFGWLALVKKECG